MFAWPLEVMYKMCSQSSSRRYGWRWGGGVGGGQGVGGGGGGEAMRISSASVNVFICRRNVYYTSFWFVVSLLGVFIVCITFIRKPFVCSDCFVQIFCFFLCGGEKEGSVSAVRKNQNLHTPPTSTPLPQPPTPTPPCFFWFWAMLKGDKWYIFSHDPPHHIPSHST